MKADIRDSTLTRNTGSLRGTRVAFYFFLIVDNILTRERTVS